MNTFTFTDDELKMIAIAVRESHSLFNPDLINSFKIAVSEGRGEAITCRCEGKESGKIKLKSDGLTCSQCNKEIF